MNKKNLNDKCEMYHNFFFTRQEILSFHFRNFGLTHFHTPDVFLWQYIAVPVITPMQNSAPIAAPAITPAS